MILSFSANTVVNSDCSTCIHNNVCGIDTEGMIECKHYQPYCEYCAFCADDKHCKLDHQFRAKDDFCSCGIFNRKGVIHEKFHCSTC